MNADRGEPLRPRLKEVEKELDQNIDAVCRSPRVEKVDTGELIRIEETLSIAASAAKQAVSLRRKLREDDAAADRDDERRKRLRDLGTGDGSEHVR